MKLLLSLTLAFIGTVAHAQNFKMVDTTPAKEVKQEVKYDSLTNMYPCNNEDYYKQFIGQSILFYPRHPKATTRRKYFGNFLVPHKLAAIDNITYRRDNKKVIPLKSYRAQHVKNEKIALCALTYKRYKEYIYNKKNRLENPEYSNSTGDFTPYNEIEGKTFRIINFRMGYLAANPSVFTLVSEDSDTLYWATEPGIDDSYTATSQRYPIIVTGYIEKMKQLYLNQDLYITNYTPAKKYKCTEIVYSGEEYQYMIPSLVLKGEDDELIIPLSVAPPLFAFDLVGNNNWQEKQGVLFDKLQIIHSREYEAKLEEERLINEAWLAELEKDRIAKKQAEAAAAEKERQAKKIRSEKEKQAREARLEKDKLAKEARQAKLEKQRLADEQAEKDRIIQKQKRKELLYKKYGQTNGKLISEGKVKIGMTKEMCIDAWGKPKSVNKSSGAWGVHEQWVYGLKTYLYFEGNKLTSIQN